MKKLMLLLIVTAALNITGISSASVIDLRPVDETFVLDPGVASPFANAANHNYGGSGSRCVSAALASAYSFDEGIADDPKGLFESILKFDCEPVSGMTVEELTLTLSISNGNRSAFGIFNSLGHSGTFGVYWMTNDWETGSGTPSSDTTSTTGVTYNSLQNIFSANTPQLLDTFYYDAANPYGSPEYYSFSFALDDPSFLDAISDGSEISLLLAPEDDEVCFNFTSYIQQNANPDKSVIREAGATLSVVVPEPSSLTLLTLASVAYIRKRRNIVE